MVNERNLKDALVALVEIMKTQLELTASAMTELSAVTSTVRVLDPTFDDTLALKRQQALQSTLPAFAGAVEMLNLLAQKMKTDVVS
jgi:uncharacterized protein (DUF2236 family)